jgi:hypothetical protein
MRQTNLILVQRVLDASQGKPSQPSSRSLANTQSNDNQHSYIFSKHHKLQFHGHSDTCNTDVCDTFLLVKSRAVRRCTTPTRSDASCITKERICHIICQLEWRQAMMLI